jgi:tight adherence protein B
MESMEYVVIGCVILCCFLFLQGVFNLWFDYQAKERRHMRERLRSLNGDSSHHIPNIDIMLRRDNMSDVGWYNNILESVAYTKKLERLRERAKVKTSIGMLIGAACVLAAVFFQAVSMAVGNMLLGGVAAFCGFFLPFMWLKKKERRRMDKFQKQLPDALDLVARALMAGHAFTQGLRMVADEFDDPIGPEFEKTLDEINFGVNTEIAMANLTDRVDCPDLKFFVVSINIQRETGGNQAEIVGNIARLVRDRFKLQGKIRVLSAEGRLSAVVLVSMPFMVGTLIRLINPEYMDSLFTTDIGKAMMGGAACSMLIGIAVIKKMIVIKV